MTTADLQLLWSSSLLMVRTPHAFFVQLFVCADSMRCCAVLCCSDKLYESSAGALLANDRTRTLLHGIRSGCIGHVQNHGHNHGHSSSHGASHHQQQQSEPQQQQQQQQQQPPPVGMFGFSTLAFLASQVAGGMRQQAAQHKQHQESEQRGVETAQLVEQHPEHAIPKSRLLVPDIPSGTLVLALNLGAYWMITKQARRSSMGGSMTG